MASRLRGAGSVNIPPVAFPPIRNHLLTYLAPAATRWKTYPSTSSSPKPSPRSSPRRPTPNRQQPRRPHLHLARRPPLLLARPRHQHRAPRILTRPPSAGASRPTSRAGNPSPRRARLLSRRSRRRLPRRALEGGGGRPRPRRGRIRTTCPTTRRKTAGRDRVPRRRRRAPGCGRRPTRCGGLSSARARPGQKRRTRTSWSRCHVRRPWL